MEQFMTSNFNSRLPLLFHCCLKILYPTVGFFTLLTIISGTADYQTSPDLLVNDPHSNGRGFRHSVLLGRENYEMGSNFGSWLSFQLPISRVDVGLHYAYADSKFFHLVTAGNFSCPKSASHQLSGTMFLCTKI